MQNPPEYIYLIDVMLDKRSNQDGFYSDIILSMSDLDKKFIANKTKLMSMLGNFVKDRVTVDETREVIIDEFTKDKKGNIVIVGSSTDKLEKYKSIIANNKIIKRKISDDIYSLRVTDGIGYLLMNDKAIKIGGASTRKFKLLFSLFDPHFGVQKSPERVMRDIRLPKDSSNQALLDSRKVDAEINKIVTNTFKEIRRLKKYKKASAKLRWDYNGRIYWLS